MKNYRIRTEQPADYREVETLAREAFWNVYRPGCTEHFILHCLRSDKDYRPELDFVMQQDGKLIGQALYMPSQLLCEDKAIEVLTLGPISILPEYQKKGYGLALLHETLECVHSMGYGAVFLEGNPEFYSRAGFSLAADYGIRQQGSNPVADNPYFLCKELREGFLSNIHGEYVTPKGYFVDEARVEDFDRSFPSREKLRLPGQLWK